MHATRFLVQGLVQGVGFRYFVYRCAERLGVSGSVRNLPGGCVEVVAAGSEDALRQLEDRLRQGPAHAHVTEVLREAVTVDRLPTDFRIEV
jgi:acylphosphatase